MKPTDRWDEFVAAGILAVACATMLALQLKARSYVASPPPAPGPVGVRPDTWGLEVHGTPLPPADTASTQ